MDTSQGWWKNPADMVAGRAAGEQAGPESTPAPDADLAGDSLGGQIDRALGDFGERIMSLKEQLQERHTEIKELEVMIADLEKEQAKAFKGLLSSNPHIKQLLGQAKSKPKTSRRKKTPKSPPEPTGDVDSESLL